MSTATAQTDTRPGTILGRALLVNVRISTWEARKHAKDVTARVADEYGTAVDVGSYHKRLFGGKRAAHQAVLNRAQQARQAHYEHTLPWGDTGTRLLPTANYEEYTAAIREIKREWEIALAEFLDLYPTFVAEARERLNGMFREEEYPSVETVRSKFSFNVEYTPLPAGDDFRVSLPSEEMERARRSVEERVAEATEEAMGECWKRLAEAVEALDVRLKDDGRYLRESMVEKIRGVAEAVSRLNVIDDPALEAIRARVLDELGEADVDVLRENEVVRSKTAERTDAILKAMEGMYSKD